MTSSVDYEPAESTTALFGGNSNWRGPVWFPVNYLLIEALAALSPATWATTSPVEYPRPGPGSSAPCRRCPSTWLSAWSRSSSRTSDGRRPVFGGLERFQTDPAWRDALLFHEYFHGDDGAGLGASHQTGWTGLVADLIVRLSEMRAVRS